MSMQIHAPSPIISGTPMSPPTNRRQSRSLSRPTSPLSPTTNLPSTVTRPGMPRPPSRSERLLRDTLRKVEEHDRMMALNTLPIPSLFGAQQPAHGFMSPPPPGGRRSRRATSSSTTTDASMDAFAYCDTGACDSDEENVYDDVGSAQWLQLSSSRSSSSSGDAIPVPHPQRPHAQPQLARHYSDDYETRHREYMDASGYVSPSSPSPVRVQLQRSARSAPNGTRPSHASPQSASRSSVDAGRGLPMQAPHSAVLHSRLEGVLRCAKDAERARSRERDSSGGSGGSNSLASSRNMSVEGEWYFAPGEQTSSPTSSSMDSSSYRKTRSRGNTTSSQTFRSPRSTNSQLPANIKVPSHHVFNPLTPPPTPPFNALTAAAQCKAMDGYVSFANIEGLGIPDGEDDCDEDEARRNGRWLKWFHRGQAKSGRDSIEGTFSR
ncbi:hypothetical protein BDY19DRAFT_208372 [Irpex rosettiformis]|uniref:Uncharacterized protein n=1 Tax=Irpex rosettiformis TaxID=378272 RepID=A0ACB8U184_9APHY|nr:hypothetical protein BDY19DRAFT_208372 [Irpex rosettiformis]